MYFTWRFLVIGIYLLLSCEVLGLSTRPRATNGGVNATYLPLNKSLSIGIVALADQKIKEIEKRRAAKRDEFQNMSVRGDIAD